jgi:hypothetical protein
MPKTRVSIDITEDKRISVNSGKNLFVINFEILDCKICRIFLFLAVSGLTKEEDLTHK